MVARSLVDPTVRRTARVEVKEEEDDTSPGVGIEFLARGAYQRSEMCAVVSGTYDDVRHYDFLDTADVDPFDPGPFQAVTSRSGAYGPGGISSSARGEVDETLRFTDRFKGFTHTFDFRVEASASIGGADKYADAGTGIEGCIGFEVIGKPAQFTFNVTVTSNALVSVRVRLSTDSPDEFDEQFDAAGSFAASGELPTDMGNHGLCYEIQAIAKAQRPASTSSYPPLVEGSVTMTLSLTQP